MEAINEHESGLLHKIIGITRQLFDAGSEKPTASYQEIRAKLRLQPVFLDRRRCNFFFPVGSFIRRKLDCGEIYGLYIFHCDGIYVEPSLPENTFIFTQLHELVHATSHPLRLNRIALDELQEETIALLATAYLSGAARLPFNEQIMPCEYYAQLCINEFGDNAQMNNVKNLLCEAIPDAERAVDYLLNFRGEKSCENFQEMIIHNG